MFSAALLESDSNLEDGSLSCCQLGGGKTRSFLQEDDGFINTMMARLSTVNI